MSLLMLLLQHGVLVMASGFSTTRYICVRVLAQGQGNVYETKTNGITGNVDVFIGS
jgi:hypothetical protein